jgi:hypothetical protein
MTVIAKHLRCDSRKVCSQCSIYLWKPSKEKSFFYYCPSCKNDILCDRGLIQDYQYDDMSQAEKVIYLCLICRTEVEDRQWPSATGLRLDMIS